MEPVFRNGFELNGPKFEPDLFINNGLACKTCKISEVCAVKKRGYDVFCFPALRSMLLQTDIYNKVSKNEPLTQKECEIHLYLDSFMCHLDRWPDAYTKPMDGYHRSDIRTDCVCEGLTSHLFGAYAASCRLFGWIAINILRNRGYHI